MDEVAEPGPPEPGMVTLAVRLCGICGTDLGEYRDGPFLIRPTAHPLTGQSPPITLGHELSAHVVAVGDGVDVELGTRVAADACWRCGTCAACRRGDYHRCRQGGSLGLHSDGALAPLVNVPDYMLVPIPDCVSDQQAALTEPLAVALHALERGEARAGDSVLVLGFGSIGGAAALIARALGCTPIVVDASPQRAQRAIELGFDVLDAGPDLPRTLRHKLGQLGTELVLECTGVPALLPQAIQCAERGGRIVLVGLAKHPASIEPSALAFYERSAIGALGYRHDLPRVIAMMAAGLLDPTPLISEIVGLADAPTALAQLAAQPDRRLKVLVRPGPT